MNITRKQINKVVIQSSKMEGINAVTYMRKKDSINELVRDFTKVFPRSKSEVRFRLWELQYNLISDLIDSLELVKDDQYYHKGVLKSIDILHQYKDNLKK